MIREDIRILIEKACSEAVPAEEVQESQLADYASTIAFRLAPKLKKSPAQIAQEIAAKIKPAGSVKKVEAVNGYVNFFLDYSQLIVPVLKEVRDKRSLYGKGTEKKRKIVLEHTSINPSGPLHIGRLRNCLIGDALARVLRFSGYDVETHYFVNDVGKQIAIIAQGFSEGIEPDAEAMEKYAEYAGKEDFQIFFEYVAANRRFEADDAFKARVQEAIQNAESGDLAALEGISNVARKCLQGQAKIYERLGVKFDFYDYESAYIRNGDVQKVLSFLKESEHARTTDKGFGLDLSAYGVARREGVSILARPDGTSVYLSRDIAYHLHKSSSGDVMINVLGEDHRFEFKELYTILSEIYRIKTPLEAVHYSFVSFEGEELSTRKGQIASVDKLLDEATEKAEEEIEKRGIATREIAHSIAVGAVKYHILKTSPHKSITFRWHEALSFEGDAAPYIQYAHARCCSIAGRSGVDVEDIRVDEIGVQLEKEEADLVKNIMRFPDAVERCARERRPSILVNYSYELASSFSRFYKQCPVLSAEEKVRDRRLLLVDATRQVLENGLNLLGIDAPEKM